MLTEAGIIEGYWAVIAQVPGATQINYWLGRAAVNVNLTDQNFPQLLAVEIIISPSVAILAGFPAGYVTLKIKAGRYHQVDNAEEVLPVQANWVTPPLERLTFETDILVSRNGLEQRIQRRSQARTVLEYDFLLYKNELNNFQNFVNDAQGRRIYIPNWAQMTKLNEDLNLTPFIRAGKFMLYAGYNYFEVVTVEGTEGNYTFNTPPTLNSMPSIWFVPLEKGSIRDRVQLGLITGEVATGNVQAIMDAFHPVKNTRSTEITPFGDTPWFHTEPNWTSELGAEITRPTGLIDYGGKTTAYDLHGFSDTVHTGQFLCNRRSYAVRDFFLDMKGRQQAFYMPSFQNDLDLVQRYDHDTTTDLIVKNVKFAEYTYTKLFIRYLRIELKGKPAIIAEIKSALSAGAEFESITVNKLDNFAPEEVFRISFVALSRFNMDALECTWITPEWYTTSASFLNIKR